MSILSGWESASTEDPQKSYLGLVLLSIFVHGLDDEIEGELLKLSDDYKLEELARRLLFGTEECNLK